METTEIDPLIEKYFEGETTLEEEKTLSAYFQESDVAPSLKKYAPLFLFYAQERAGRMDSDLAAPEAVLSRPVVLKAQKTPKLFYLNPIFLKTAIIVLLFSAGVAVWFKYPVLPKNKSVLASNNRKAKTITFDENDDPQLAYLKIRSALMMVSGEMKKGTEPIQNGMEKMSAATRLIEQ